MPSLRSLLKNFTHLQSSPVLSPGLWTDVRIRLALVWFAFVNLLKVVLVPRRPLPDAIKVAVIGDGFAIGIGDYITPLAPYGLAQRLEFHFGNLNRPTRIDACPVVVESYGDLCTSESWTPTAESGLYRDTFGANGSARDADIVLVHLGTLDHERLGNLTPEQTVKNIEALVTQLSLLGKNVWVAIPPNRGHTMKGSNLMSKRQQQLKELLRSGIEGVRMGVDCSRRLWEDSSNYWLDRIHFASHGYKTLTVEWAEIIKPTVVVQEWQRIKRVLVPERNKPNSDRENCMRARREGCLTKRLRGR